MKQKKMKRFGNFSNTWLLTIVTAFLGTLAATDASAFSGQAPAGYTGAPPDSQTCSNCHFGAGTEVMEIVFDNGRTTYEPGVTYPMSIVLEDTGQERFGYSMTSRLQSSLNTSTGTWTAGMSSAVTDNGRHIGHMNAPFASNTYTFQMSWTAPVEEVGDIRFYAVGNAANGNFGRGQGDNIYTRQLVITPALPFTTFWPLSLVEEGWRDTTDGYPDMTGIGWIYDLDWPWYYTFQQTGFPDPDWILVYPDDGTIDGFWGYNATRGYFFYAFPSVGWYYSFEPGLEGWYMYDL
jgi:hypothetical protein